MTTKSSLTLKNLSPASLGTTSDTVILGLTILTFVLAAERHLALIVSPFQQEYREGATIFITQLLLSGEQPYALANQPLATNVYGILYNLVVTPFASVYGATLTVHRAVSGAFIVASCGVLFIWLRSIETPPVAAFCGSLFLYVSSLFFTTPLTRPDSLGLFIFLLSLYIPARLRFSVLGLAIHVFLCGLLFLTKVYFLVGGAIVASYLFLFVSKRTAIWLGTALMATVAGLLTASVLLLETYANQVFGISANLATRNYLHLLRQLYTLTAHYLPVIALGIGVLAWRLFVRNQRPHAKETSRDTFDAIGFDLRRYDAPLLAKKVSFETFALLVISSVLILLLGLHDGAFMTYFYELFTPFLVLVMFRHAAGIVPVHVISIVFVANALLFVYRNIATSSQIRETASWGEIEASTLR